MVFIKKRKLGATGLEVSEIGFGSWQLGNTKAWQGIPEKKAVTLVQQAIKKGCNLFDTAPNYAGGRSEKLLGKAVQNKRNNVIITTKFGHFPDGTEDLSPNLIKDSVENSLQALQTDYLDSVLLHSPPLEILDNSQGHFDILKELKQAGKIKTYGASVDNSEEMLTLLNNTEAQVVEILFNLFHQEPKQAFPRAKEKGVGLIAKVPLDSGWLTGKYDKTSSFTDIRSRWSEKTINRRAKLVKKLQNIKPTEASFVQEALRFILSFSAISSVIPGIKNEKQLIENLSANKKELPEARKKEYEQFYQQHLADNHLPW